MSKEIGILGLLREICIMVLKLIGGALKILVIFISIVIFRSNK